MQKTPKENMNYKLENDYNDISSANSRGLVSYVVTPNGNLKKYDPSSGENIVVSSDMPCDKNAGNYRVNDNIVEKQSFIQQLINAIISNYK